MATLRNKIGYGLGDVSTSIFWKICSVYIPIYYDHVFGLSFTQMGALLFTTLLLSTVTDPLIGIIADRTQTKWGRYRPYLLWIAVPFCACAVLMFTTPNLSFGAKHMWAYVTYILMMTCYSAVVIPHAAMLNIVTFDTQEKTNLAAYRMFFASAAGTIALASWEPLCTYFKNLTGAVTTGWQGAFMIFAPICLIFFILCFTFTKEQISVKHTPLKRDLKFLFGNFPWWLLSFASVCHCLFSIVRSTCVAFYFNYYNFNGVNASVSIGFTRIILYTGLFLAVGEFFAMIGTMFAPSIAKQLGKRNTYLLSNGIIVVLSILFCFVPQTATGFTVMGILQVIISICTGIVAPLIWSMYADVATFTRWKDQSYCAGLILTSASFARKLGLVVGGPSVLVVLEMLGYASGSYVRTDNILDGLLLCMGGMSAFFALAQVLLMMHYPLTPKRMREIRSVLDTEYNHHVNDLFLASAWRKTEQGGKVEREKTIEKEENTEPPVFWGDGI